MFSDIFSLFIFEVKSSTAISILLESALITASFTDNTNWYQWTGPNYL